MPKRRAVLAWLVAAAPALGAVACAEPTQLVVVVSTDMTVPDEVEQIRVRVMHVADSTPVYDNTIPLPSSGTPSVSFRALLSFGAGPRDEDTSRRVRVLVDAVAGGRTRFTTEARTGFAHRKRLRLDVFLARRCLTQAVTCRPDQTCGLPGCVSPDVPVAALPPAGSPPTDVPTDPRAAFSPRLLRPLSLATTTTRSPTLTFAPASADAEHVVLVDPDAPGGPAVTLPLAPGADRVRAPVLAPGVHTWRVDARIAGEVVGSSATWELFVPRVEATPANDLAWGAIPDVNRDGLGDLVVASDRHVEVFLGRRGGPSVAPDHVLLPLSAGGVLVSDVAVADVDGDGFGDVVVAVVGACGVPAEVVVYLGGPDAVAEARAARTALTMATDGPLSIASGGDLDGDGGAELLVGAPGTTGDGHVLVLYRAHEAGSITIADVSVPADSGFGSSVAALGPFDADSLDDFLVASAVTHRLYVYRGGAAPMLVASETASLAGPILSMAPAGDFLAEGRPCVLIAVDAATGSTNTGIVCGSTGALDRLSSGSWSGVTSDEYGASVASGGDLDDDGRLDVVIGMPAQGGDVGGVEVRRSTRLLHVVYPTSSMVGERFGTRVAGVGDLDGDGADDVAVGAPYRGGFGRVYVIRGGPDVLTADFVRDPGDASVTRFGHAIASR